ncbi:hypothetical protein BJ742DRAFT_273166 [Cladochytrium replicatum]|nr:hypothetical protein BJ742DRAFT_273166 [Cladochytrium replicatum]
MAHYEDRTAPAVSFALSAANPSNEPNETIAEPRLRRTQTSAAMADIAHRYAKYNTIDFEEPDGPNLRDHYARQSFSSKFLQGGTEFVLVVFFTVIIAFLWIGLFFATEIVIERRIEYIAELLDDSPFKAVGIAILISLVCAIIPAILVVYIAPSSNGSGMTSVISFLNGSADMHSHDLIPTVIRIIGAFGIVASGLYSGIDGPFAHIGASVCIIGITGILQSHFLRRIFFGEARKAVYTTPSVFQRVTGRSSSRSSDGLTYSGEDKDGEISAEDRARLASNFGWNALLDFLKARRVRTFATIGAAVAITAIFRSPLGGVVFALEEATSYFVSTQLMANMRGLKWDSL